jgi:hypothetical protein
MTRNKLLILFVLTAVVAFGTAAQSNCDSKKNKNSVANAVSNNSVSNNSNKSAESPSVQNDVKTLAEGSYGQMENPFLYVVRSAETYRRLQSKIENLPANPGVDFEKQAIVAAFAGTKNTGGYSVEITRSGEKISVAVKNPPPGAMVTEALTMPYKVAAVSIEPENGLNLEVGNEWKNSAQVYTVSSGEFESSGGIMGRLKKFSADGTINVWQFGELVTMDFNLAGTGANKNLQLGETASGTITSGKIELARLDAGTFSEGPKPPVKVSGTASGDKLNLTFEPLPAKAADGFQVGGKLEAVKTK